MGGIFSVSTQLMELGTNRKFTVTGTSSGDNATLAQAKAEHDAKLKLTVGLPLKTTQSEQIATGTAHGNAGTYSDAVLVLSKGVMFPTRSVALQDISTEYTSSVDAGALDVTHADLVAFATNYRDAEGDNGYTLIKGYWTD